MTLINCEINLMLTWFTNCIISSNAAADQGTIFAITDTKLYVAAVTLSIKDNAKLLQQLKSGFKCIIIWNKYQSKVSTRTRNQYLDHSINPSFQKVKRLFVLTFENKAHQISHFFDQAVLNDERIYNNIQKITNGQGDDNTTGLLLDYPYSKNIRK